MGEHSVVIHLPGDVFERVERAARGLRQPLPQALLKIVEAGLPPLAGVPQQSRQDLEPLEAMNDNRLRKVARSTMPAGRQRRRSDLMEKERADNLTGEVREELQRFPPEAIRLMVQMS